MKEPVQYCTLLAFLLFILSHQTFPRFHIKKLKKKSNRLFLILLLSFFIQTFELFAQEITGKIEGRIIDENGSAVPGVLITLSSLNLQGMRTTQTNKDGFYRFILLPPRSEFLCKFYFLSFIEIKNRWTVKI